MQGDSKVIWSEGMFLQPQHFQQQERYFESLLNGRCVPLQPYGWGVTELTIDRELLALGRLAVKSCRGLLPDGTPVDIPERHAPPEPLEIPQQAKNALVYLCVPVRRGEAPEADHAEAPQSGARYLLAESEVNDSNAWGETTATVQTGELRLSLLLEEQPRSGFVCLGIARIVERSAEGDVTLDNEYLPPCLDCQCLPRLASLITEITGLLNHRGDELAARMVEPGRAGVAEIVDFLLLQVVNRYQPWFAHLQTLRGLHPESFYAAATQLAGELATFTSPRKRCPELPGYRHDALRESFEPLMRELRRSLSVVLEQNAILLPLKEHKYGIRVAAVADRSLYKSAMLVLAVNAQMPVERLQKRFPDQVTIGPVEKISKLVNSHLPGIDLRSLPVAPRQIPYHAGFSYFELDRGGTLWEELSQSAGCALHVSGDFPELQLELWAIRG